MDKNLIDQKRFLGENVPTEAVRQGTAYLNKIPSPSSQTASKQMGKSPKK